VSFAGVELSADLRLLQLEWLDQFRRRTRLSAEADQAAANDIAKTQRSRFSSGMPYPVYISEGSGARFTDLDGNPYLDCTAGWNAGLLGRGDPSIAAAVAEEMGRTGAPGGAMHPSLVRDHFAQMVCTRVPGAERLLFAPSGSEANTYALRLARAATGREKILRMKGGYHGQGDYLLAPKSSLLGLPGSVSSAVLECPYNDADSVDRILAAHTDEVAAIICEPMMTIPGAVHQRSSFLQRVRSISLDHDVPFILDEVITGMRFATGGATEFYAVTPPPDLIVMGKMLGGGLPVAVVAGRRDLVERPISASNTHAQHPVALAAAVAQMERVSPREYRQLSDQGGTLRAGLRAIARDLPFPLQVTGDGPCCGVHFTEHEVTNAAIAQEADQELWRLMCLGATNLGLAISSRTFGPILPYEDRDVQCVLQAFARTLDEIGRAASKGADFGLPRSN
jgi:glutamate-1-semialdehyde 2,1-aminomutase